MIIPMKIRAIAISQASICGYRIINTPRAMKRIPGSIIQNPEPDFSIMPLHVFAIGHVGIGVVSTMTYFIWKLLQAAVCRP